MLELDPVPVCALSWLVAFALYYFGEVQMPNMFTKEGYADMYFVYDFCNGNLGLLLCNSGEYIHRWIAYCRTHRGLR